MAASGPRRPAPDVERLLAALPGSLQPGLRMSNEYDHSHPSKPAQSGLPVQATLFAACRAQTHRDQRAALSQGLRSRSCAVVGVLVLGTLVGVSASRAETVIRTWVRHRRTAHRSSTRTGACFGRSLRSCPMKHRQRCGFRCDMNACAKRHGRCRRYATRKPDGSLMHADGSRSPACRSCWSGSAGMRSRLR